MRPPLEVRPLRLPALVCSLWLCAPLAAEGLEVRLAGERLRVSAPRLTFISGQALERLRNGAPVPFALQLSLSAERNSPVLVREIQRFVLSYDLWEEKFAVSRLGHPRKSASHLSAREAEAWCIDEMSLEPAGISERQNFWLRLEVRAENPGERAGQGEDPVSLARLIELFSRRARGEHRRWVAEAGPLRLTDLRQAVLSAWMAP